MKAHRGKSVGLGTTTETGFTPEEEEAYAACNRFSCKHEACMSRLM